MSLDNVTINVWHRVGVAVAQKRYVGRYRYRAIQSHITSYHIVDLKRQNRLKVGTNKLKLS